MKLFTKTLLLSGLAILQACSGASNKDDETQNPTMKHQFLWDFSDIEDISYTYELTSIETESFDRNSLPYSIRTETTGDLIVGSHGDRTASVSIRNVVKTLFSLTDAGEWSPAKPQNYGVLAIGELKQYSQFTDERLNAVWDAYLPLPLEEINKGEIYKLKMSIPVGMEQHKYVKGYNTLKFEGYETLNGRKCIVLKGNIDVTELDELEFEGEYEHTLKGTGTYYFDAKEHIYVGADVKIVLTRKGDSGETEEAIKDLFMYSVIDETFKIRLK